VRFPTMAPQDIAELVQPSGLISKEELTDIFIGMFRRPPAASDGDRKTAAGRWNFKPRGLSFAYQSDMDTNGFLYWLGTEGMRDKEWRNPARTGKAKVIFSSFAPELDQTIQPEAIGRAEHSIYTHNIPNSSIAIDFMSYAIIPSAYTIRTWTAGGWEGQSGSYHLRSWRFQGSNDLTNWSDISIHQNDTSLERQGQTHTWMIQTPLTGNKPFRAVRILQTDQNSGNLANHIICMSSFEIYGRVQKFEGK